ncbi:MAG: hypothetical protein Q7R87_03640 [Nanoarchaeota archaeon]|nr:hypothetical protein [Nanoarchaeota archaeon]
MAEKMKIKVLEPKIKEIKVESNKKEISELEQEVSDESILSQMPRGNFNTSLPVNMNGQELDESLQIPIQRMRDESANLSSQTTYGSNQTSQASLEAKYQVRSLAEQRVQTAVNIARERENIRTQSNFENPDLRQFGSAQSGSEDYNSRIQTSDVSVKRRNHWEGG